MDENDAAKFMNTAKYLLVSFALLLLSYDAAFACRCLRKKPSRDLSHFATVFTGKVTEVDHRSGKTKFQVDRIWKGARAGEIVISGGNSSCDWYFEKGESYLVYALSSPETRTYTTHKCTRTGRLADATEDLEVLGEGQAPSSQSRSRFQQQEADAISPLKQGMIAFNSNRTGNDEIYVMNADASGVRSLTNDDRFDSWWPGFSQSLGFALWVDER